jgi:RHS repeat-associated protein
MTGDPSAQVMPLGGGETNTTTGGFGVSAAFTGIFSGSLGASLSTGARDEFVGMYDVDGDGLPDQLYRTPTGVAVLYNRSTPGSHPDILFQDNSAASVVGLPAMGHENHDSWNVNTSGTASLNLFSGKAGISGGTSLSYSNSTSRSARFLTDLDGDGFVDYLEAHPLTSHPCDQGTCFTDASYGALASIDPRQDPLLASFGDQIEQRLILGDPIVQWVAPFSGHIVINGTAQKVLSGGTNGVTVELYHDNAALAGITIAPDNTGELVFPSSSVSLDVNSGEALYIRVKNNGDDGLATDGTLYDQVDARLSVAYQTVCEGAPPCTPIADPYAAREPTGAYVYAFDSFNDFRIAGTPVFVVASVPGTIAIHGMLTKQISAADVRVCVQRFPAASPGFTPQLDAPCDATGTDATNISGTIALSAIPAASLPIDLSVPVDTGQLLMLRVESDFSIDPSNVAFVPSAPSQPTAAYSTVCLPTDTGTECSSDPSALAKVQLVPVSSTTFGPYVALVNSPPASPPMPLVVAADATISFNSLDLGDGFLFAIRSNLRGTLAEFDCRIVSCGPLSLPSFPVAAGESISFEEVTVGLPFAASVTGTLSPGSTFSIPIIAYSSTPPQKAPSPFFGGYHGWHAGFWNEAYAFAPATLLTNYQQVSLLTPVDQLTLLRTAFPPVASFGTDAFTGNAPSWLGPESTSFVSALGVNAGYLGELSEQGASSSDSVGSRGGLFTAGYARLSGTTGLYIGTNAQLTVVHISGSIEADVGASSTISTTDVLDMNGDGVADVLAGGNSELGAMTTSPQGGGVVPDFAAAAELRKRHGYDYSINLGGGAVGPVTTSAGRTLIESQVTNQGGGVGVSSNTGLAVGRSETTDDLEDLNGDGLPDLVHRSGVNISVRYNLGNRFGAWEPFGQVDVSLLPPFQIDGFQGFEQGSILGFDSTSDAISHDTTITQTHTTSVNLVLYSHTETTRVTASRATRQLADLNGDGLPDLLVKKDGGPIQVQYNLGGNFAPAINWSTPQWLLADNTPIQLSPIFDDATVQSLFIPLGLTGPDVLAGTGAQQSSSSSDSVNIPVPGTPINVGGHFDHSTDIDTYELALIDVDGDGAADHVLRRTTVGGTPTVYVKYNLVSGKANLLKTVHRPLGGTIDLDYTRVGNTVAMPHSRQVLNQVSVDDGANLGDAFNSPPITTRIEYADGFFSRHEKAFFGFSQVATTRFDKVKVTDQYENLTYPLHGRLLNETRVDKDGNLFHQHAIAYATLSVFGPDGNAVQTDTSCTANLHPLLGLDACTPLFPVVVRDEDTRAEIGSAQKTRKFIDRDVDHDRFGNVLASTDSGDDAIASDDLYATAIYFNDPDHWILGRATQLQVLSGSGTLLRSRIGDYDSFGELIAVHVDTGSGNATTQLAYDMFGNLANVTTPPNESGQSQTFQVIYDSDVAIYPVQTLDGFGDTASATYDLAFGVATIETDINGNKLTRTLDNFGRLATVSGPYDTSAPALKMSYYPDEPHPRAVTETHASAPPGYSGPVPATVTTVTIADGLGRAIELNKTAVVDGVAGMTTSGLVKRDDVGRVVQTQTPFFTPGATTAFITPMVTKTTMIDYDALDRPVKTTYPDLAVETNSFDVVADPSGTLLFLARTIAPNLHARESYLDHVGRTRTFVEHPSDTSMSVTHYDYLPTGELSHITDAEGNQTSFTYDRRGLRTLLDNPDDGQIADTYDLMGNRITLVEPNHRALGTSIHYGYERDRLVTIDYPSKPDVTFTYGPPCPPASVCTSAGRIIAVADETGTQQHEYGALGEVRRTVRTVISGNQTYTFDLRMTSDSLGRLLQIGYPDGEVVTNTYDAAGMINQVVGAGGNAWSRTYASDIRYDVFGNRDHVLYGNGAVSTWSFDPNRVRLQEVTTTFRSFGTIQDLQYTYDAASNPTQIVNALKSPLSGGSGTMPGRSTLTLTYDGVDRLTMAMGHADLNAQKTTDYTQLSTFSASHNLLHKERAHSITLNSGGTTTQGATSFASDYIYGARPHLPTRIGQLGIVYDPSGNPTTRTKLDTGSVQNLVWDDDNRMVDYTSGGVHQHNTFDASGTRVDRKSTQSETIFSSQYFDLENGTQGVKHVFAGSQRVASELTKFASGTDPTAPSKQGTAYFFHQDHLASTHVLTDDSGGIQESLEYFVDGELWIDRGPQKPVTGYLFSGKPFDPDTGLYDFGQRFYEPRTSLWLGLDSAFKEKPDIVASKPVLLAPLAYAAHSPVAHTDPDGRCPLCVAVFFYLWATEDEAGENARPELTTADLAVTAGSFVVGGAIAGRLAPFLGEGPVGKAASRTLGGVGGSLSAQGGHDIVHREFSGIEAYKEAIVTGAVSALLYHGATEVFGGGGGPEPEPLPESNGRARLLAPEEMEDVWGAAPGAEPRGFSSGRAPHRATITVTRGGKLVRSEALRSGNMTEEEAALWFPRSSLATHTESRGVRNGDFRPGDVVKIKGKYRPCPACKGAMNKAARETGASITYYWPGGKWEATGK